MDTYVAGSSQQQVSLTVDINTVGLAASRAIIIQVNPPSEGIPVAHSENATGDIPQRSIGEANTLQHKRLSILTKIDLWGDDQQRKDQYDSISASYTLDGGDQGLKSYTQPLKSVDATYTSAFLHKPIDLI